MKNFVLRSIGVIGALSFFGLFGACGGAESSSPAAGGSGGGGGTGGTVGDGGVQCATINFVSPKTGTALTASDDKDKDGCANGFQYDVSVTTSANDGVAATLFANNSLVATSKVSGGKASFSSVTLDSFGSTVLKVQIGPQSCYETSTVSVSCGGVSCSISKPVISPTHPALNGVPVAEGGDRASAVGNPYQVAFEVTTSAESGSTVSLEVDKKADSVKAQVGADGKARFAGVTLTPDGNHSVKALCKALSGPTGTSAEAIFPVDTKAPDMTVSGVASNQAITVAEDIDPATDGIQFDVCGQTKATDATDLPASLGTAAQKNFCVKNGSSPASCEPVKSGKGCVRLDCNAIGSAAQTVVVTIKDAAGNPAKETFTEVKCQTGNPTVQIVDPVAYDPASSGPVILNKSKDADPAVYGFQYAVTACTNAPAGSKATLQHKAPQQQSAPIGGEVDVVAAQASDNCPTGLPNVAKWPGVTLAESSELADGTLVEVTRLRADVVVGGATYSSASMDEWVDSTAPGPYLTFVTDPTTSAPVACNGVIKSLVDVTTSLYAGCDAQIPVFARITHEDSSVDTTPTVSGSGALKIDGVNLKTGLNTIVIEGTEPAGNTGTSAGCAITVGNPPDLKFTNISNSTVFNLASVDVDAATDGFQTDIVLSSSDTADPVSLTIQGQEVGQLIPSGGIATFTAVTLPDADALIIKATQTASGGTATRSVAVKVDRHAPSSAASPASSIADRRAASANLTFSAPSDYDPLNQGQRAVASYELRRLQVQANADCSTALTDANFSTATQVPSGGVPIAPGATDTRLVDAMITGRSYCFGLRASDSAGNTGPLTVFPLLEPAWLSKVMTPPAVGVTNFGRGLLGTADLDRDGFTDLVVAGDPNSVWIYYGTDQGLESAPSVQIKGPAGALFGNAIEDLGNFDGSTEPKPLPEIAIAAQLLNSQGGVFIFSLPASLHAQPMTTIEIGASGAPVSGSLGAHFAILTDGSPSYASALLGGAVSNIGDFDGDGLPDVVIGARGYESQTGRAHLFRGRTAAGLTTLVAGVQSEIEFTSSVPGGLLGIAIAPLGNSGVSSLGGTGGVVLGIPKANGTGGALYGFAGTPVPYGAHFVWDVAAKASVTSIGADGDYLGGGAWLLGDADGDGLDDYLACNFGPDGQSTGFIVYGGSSWGATARINNDLSPAKDRMVYRAAARPLAPTGVSLLNGDTRADAAFASYLTDGASSLTAWIVNGTAKLSGTHPVSSLGVKPPVPAGAASVSSMTFAPRAAGGDLWPDVLIGSASANGGAGQVIVVY